ncbi:hypothetical protein OG21DRAFT_659174 [Imleria badia]|nr:hypothetical protein OG21DRAFT_659174 [Imleria badia]
MAGPMFCLIAGAVVAYTVYQIFFADNGDSDRPHESQPSVYRRDERQHRQTIHSSQPPVYRRDEPQHQQTIHSSQPQAPVYRHDEPQHRQTIDSSQRDPTPLETYASLRARAKQEGDLMAQCHKQRKEASRRRDRARAKALLEEGKRHATKMEKLNAQASAIIFKENNQDKAACKVDLHGLYVKEAIAYSKQAIADAGRRGDSEIRLIVGQGNHSEGGVSRLKPAIQRKMQMCGHRVEVDPRNPGVLLVRLGRM